MAADGGEATGATAPAEEVEPLLLDATTAATSATLPGTVTGTIIPPAVVAVAVAVRVSVVADSDTSRGIASAEAIAAAVALEAEAAAALEAEAEAAAAARLASGAAGLGTWRGTAPHPRSEAVVAEEEAAVSGAGRLVTWLGIAAWKEGGGLAVAATVVAEAVAMLGRARALIVGSLDILQGSALRPLVESEAWRRSVTFCQGKKRWNSTYSLFFLHLLTVNIN